MIKVVNVKSILKLMLIIAIIISFIFILKNKLNTIKNIQVSNTNSSQYKILVDVEDSKLYLFENNIVIKTYKCSGGKSSTPSPIGTWKIISKAKWGEGFGRKFYGYKCSMGTVWYTWYTRSIFFRMGKLTWLYKNEH